MAISPSNPPETPEARHLNPADPFDIHKSYATHTHSPQNLPPHLAAIAALTAALPAHHLSTLSEALSLLSSLAHSLSTSLEEQGLDQVPASAGTDIFLHYLVNNVARSVDQGEDVGDFVKVIGGIGERFVGKGLRARSMVMGWRRRVITEGATVVVTEVDEVVVGMLVGAAEAGTDFRVVFVEACGGDAKTHEVLRANEVPFMTVPTSTVGAAMLSLTSGREGMNVNGNSGAGQNPVIVAPAAAILPTGGAWTSASTLQTCMLAREIGVDVLIVGELLKLVRSCPKLRPLLSWEGSGKTQAGERGNMQALDPDYITAFVTENGLMVPNAVAEETIKIWF